MPIPPMVSQRSLRALSVLSPSLGFVCVGLSLMRVVYQVCSSSGGMENELGVNIPVVIVRWFHPLTEAAATAATQLDWMPKSVCVLLACLVLAAGQAAKRDTTQWRCRNPRIVACRSDSGVHDSGVQERQQ